MYPALQKELAAYEKRTPKSRAAHQDASSRVSLGVGSNYGFYPPYPVFVRDGAGSRTHDVGGIVTYTGGASLGRLTEIPVFFGILTIGLLWLTARVRGLRVGKWVDNAGGIGTLAAAPVLIALGGWTAIEA